MTDGDDDIRLIQGDCLDVLPTLGDNSVDSIVTDPPYGLRFLGRKWDYDVPSVAIWEQCLRVLKPGGHLLAFAGTRTQHRMAVRIEDAGFEIRDMMAWNYAGGFPKSLDVSKAIDKARDDNDDVLRVTQFMANAAERAGLTRSHVDAHMGTSDMGGWWLSRLRHRCQCPRWEQWLLLKDLLGLSDEMDDEVWRLNGRKGKPGDAWVDREVIGSAHRKATGRMAQGEGGYAFGENFAITAPATAAAKRWAGFGTALKPSFEPITVARKPLRSIAVNVVDMVESEMRNRGFLGAINWKNEPARDVVAGRHRRNSSSIEAPPVAGTYVAFADENEIKNEESMTRNRSGPQPEIGPAIIASDPGPLAGHLMPNFDERLLRDTEECVHVAESKKMLFSPSTTSMEEEPSTENRSGKYMAGFVEKDSRQDFECFAGIATGVTGSLAYVLIKRDSEGSFIWPNGLPREIGPQQLTVADNVLMHGTGAINIDGCRVGMDGQGASDRWPANFLHDGSDEATGPLGSAARYFFCAKASKSDRGPGNDWPTVKPTDLMRYLVRLVTPPGGTTLDPFLGSGSTGKAAILEGFRFVGIELDDHAMAIARRRIDAARLPMFDRPDPASAPTPRAARPAFAFATEDPA